MLRVAFQIDPIESLNQNSDSSLALLEAALDLSMQVYSYQASDLYYKQGTVSAFTREIKLVNGRLQQQESGNLNLAKDLDIIWVRSEPPFDMSYITATYLLDLVKDNVQVYNDPTSIRNWPEKLAICQLWQYMPQTLITANVEQAMDFFKQIKTIVLKPLYAFGGQDIKKITSQLQLEESFLELKIKYNNLPIICQEFLPKITEGDKRVLLYAGKILGAVNRLPHKGDFRANMVLGGNAESTKLNSKEQIICQDLADKLYTDKIIFAGIDIIDNKVTEINVTCPTGIQTINKLYGLNSSKRLEYYMWHEILKGF